MGIKGLQTLFKSDYSSASYRVPLSDAIDRWINGERHEAECFDSESKISIPIVVDGSSLLYWICNESYQQSTPSVLLDYNALFVHATRWFTDIITCVDLAAIECESNRHNPTNNHNAGYGSKHRSPLYQCRIYVVFDGTIPPNKWSCKIKRLLKQCTHVRHFLAHQIDHMKSLVPIHGISCIADAVHHLSNEDYHRCLFAQSEADKAIAALASDLSALFVISNDSDFILFQTANSRHHHWKIVPFNTISMISGQSSCSAVGYLPNERILSKLSVPLHMERFLPIIAALVGNDYSPDSYIKEVGECLLHVSRWKHDIKRGKDWSVMEADPDICRSNDSGSHGVVDRNKKASAFAKSKTKSLKEREKERARIKARNLSQSRCQQVSREEANLSKTMDEKKATPNLVDFDLAIEMEVDLDIDEDININVEGNKESFEVTTNCRGISHSTVFSDTTSSYEVLSEKHLHDHCTSGTGATTQNNQRHRRGCTIAHAMEFLRFVFQHPFFQDAYSFATPTEEEELTTLVISCLLGIPMEHVLKYTRDFTSQLNSFTCRTCNQMNDSQHYKHKRCSEASCRFYVLHNMKHSQRLSVHIASAIKESINQYSLPPQELQSILLAELPSYSKRFGMQKMSVEHQLSPDLRQVLRMDHGSSRLFVCKIVAESCCQSTFDDLRTVRANLLAHLLLLPLNGAKEKPIPGCTNFVIREVCKNISAVKMTSTDSSNASLTERLFRVHPASNILVVSPSISLVNRHDNLPLLSTIVNDVINLLLLTNEMKNEMESDRKMITPEENLALEESTAMYTRQFQRILRHLALLLCRTNCLHGRSSTTDEESLIDFLWSEDSSVHRKSGGEEGREESVSNNLVDAWAAVQVSVLHVNYAVEIAVAKYSLVNETICSNNRQTIILLDEVRKGLRLWNRNR